MKSREGKVADGAPIIARADRIPYEMVRDDLERHYEATGERDLAEYRRRVNLTRFFGGRHVATIGQPDVDAYIAQRQAKGAKGSTIRRELGTLTKMLRLAYQNGEPLRLPLRRGKVFSSAISTQPCGSTWRPISSRRRDRLHLRLADAE